MFHGFTNLPDGGQEWREKRDMRDERDKGEIQAIFTSSCVGFARRAFLAPPANLAD